MYISQGEKEKKKEKASITWQCIENLRWADLTWGFLDGMDCLGVRLVVGSVFVLYRYGCLPACLAACVSG